MSVEDEIYYNELFAEYSPLLTENQRSVFEMYFSLDLSLGEIAEIKGVSRQGVADVVSSVKKQLKDLESKLGFVAKKNAVYKLIDEHCDCESDIKNQIKQILGDG